jgi:general stress protein 26
MNSNSSNSDETSFEALSKFKSLISGFDDAMLVSSDVHGQPHARPMRIAN